MKEKKEKKTRKLHPMSEENSKLLDEIEELIKKHIASSLISDGYKSINDRVDEILANILREIELILKTMNSWDDVNNLSRIYHSYVSMRFLLSSFVPVFLSYIQRDEQSKYILQSIAIATGRQYLKSLRAANQQTDLSASELKYILSFTPLISFFIDNVDCEQSESNMVICRLSAKYVNKSFLNTITTILGDLLSEINVSVIKSQISDSGQFAILTLKMNSNT